MNPAPPLRVRQGFAVAILAVLLLVVWYSVIWPTLDLAVTRRAEIRALAERLHDLQAVERRAPTLERRERAAVSRLQSLGVFWSGPSAAAISAAMQDLIRTAAQQGGGLVNSSSALPDTVESNAMMGVRARVDGTLDTLQHVLAAADSARPKLFLSNLAISMVAPATREHPTQISFEFSVSGYVTATHAP